MSRDDKNKELRGLIAYYLETSGYTKKQLALKLGIRECTMEKTFYMDCFFCFMSDIEIK